jgi:hypothetical protein
MYAFVLEPGYDGYCIGVVLPLIAISMPCLHIIVHLCLAMSMHLWLYVLCLLYA